MFDPSQMAKMMKQLGIRTTEISASKVIIDQGDSKIIIEDPQVIRIDMKGNVMFQVSGKIREEISINEEDIQLVMEKANVDREKAVEALKASNGDIAEAILKASQ